MLSIKKLTWFFPYTYDACKTRFSFVNAHVKASARLFKMFSNVKEWISFCCSCRLSQGLAIRASGVCKLFLASGILRNRHETVTDLLPPCFTTLHKWLVVVWIFLNNWVKKFRSFWKKIDEKELFDPLL